MVQLSPLYHPALRLAPWRALADDDLGKAGDEEVVWKSLDAAGGQLRPLATQRTRELAVVGVLLVRRLGGHVTLDAVFAERVQAGEALGTPVGLEADLTDEKLVVDLLRQTSAERAR